MPSKPAAQATSQATAQATAQPTEPDQAYDRYAIFHPTHSPIHPGFMREAVRTLMRALPIDPDEPKAWADRRMHAALLGLAALNPRDEIEVMLAIQALCAYHAAAAGWHVGMNHHRPSGDSTRHFASAASAARTFDTLLKALERRQAKPLTVPIGRPEPRAWDTEPPHTNLTDWEGRCQEDLELPPTPERVAWTDDALKTADALATTDTLATTGALDALDRNAPTPDDGPVEGVLPDGSIIMPENPTPLQARYIAGRLTLDYRREVERRRRRGLMHLPPIRGIPPGERIP